MKATSHFPSHIPSLCMHGPYNTIYTNMKCDGSPLARIIYKIMTLEANIDHFGCNCNSDAFIRE